jgi:hypothetical protein
MFKISNTSFENAGHGIVGGIQRPQGGCDETGRLNMTKLD